MKITVKELVNKEVEISTPCYVKSKSGYHVYHVIDEKQAIQIFNGFTGPSIGFVNPTLAFSDDYSIIKASEFKEVFNNVLKSFVL